MARRANGEGTIYRRKDGRYEAAAYFQTTTGLRKRIRFYGATRDEVHRKLTAAANQSQRGIPTANRTWRVGDYLDYWLEQVVRPNRRPKTYETYELRVRLDLKPHLGKYQLQRLSVPMIQTFVNQRLAAGDSVRKVQIMRTVLGAALSRAMREELISRNVARFVELPAWERGEIKPWNSDEATEFIGAARGNPLFAAYLLLVLYGLRRGEVLGLRWRDVDFTEGQLHVRQQLQRVAGELHQGPVKTKAGRRDLPMVSLARSALTRHQQSQEVARAAAGEVWQRNGGDELVFTSVTGRPIEPNNFVRSFQRLCRQQGLRVIKMHHLRHTAATLLKKLGVPARDAQLILGHSQVSITQEIYQHVDMDSRTEAIEKVAAVFEANNQNDGRCRQALPSFDRIREVVGWIISGGPTGARTQDTLLKSSISPGVNQRATTVKLQAQRRMRQWVLGSAAVSISRQSPSDSPLLGVA
jgi:integrase